MSVVALAVALSGKSVFYLRSILRKGAGFAEFSQRTDLGFWCGLLGNLMFGSGDGGGWFCVSRFMWRVGAGVAQV